VSGCKRVLVEYKDDRGNRSRDKRVLKSAEEVVELLAESVERLSRSTKR